jgi:hypothetical protein
MVLTAEQQFQLDLETARNNNQLAVAAKQAKLEAVRLAQHTLLENRRNLPVDAREVTAADITAFATTLVNYVNS